MNKPKSTRRQFLQRSAAAGTLGAFVPYWCTSLSAAAGAEPKTDRLTTAAIGVGGRGTAIATQLRERSDMVAVCDVDRNHADRFKSDSNIKVYNDYRDLLDREDIDAVTIGTPDHWHTAICLHALRTGKDVYCEKPLTLTIDEGKLLAKTVRETGRVLQVGTQQRTGYNRHFLRAIAIAHAGRLGKIHRVTVSIDTAPKKANKGPFATADPPAGLDWDLWLGQAPLVPYTPERCHYSFRYWYDYSGGNLTDWGVHHVDIAQWAIGMQHSGPTKIEPLAVRFPDHANENGFNTAYEYRVRCEFPNGVELFLDHQDRQVLIEGDQGRIAVNRGGLRGQLFEEITSSAEQRDWLEEQVVRLFAGREPKEHMDNFLDAVKDRKLPMSDVFTHHRALSTCHLCNIALRTGRVVTWDPENETAIDDNDINENWVRREQREPYQFG